MPKYTIQKGFTIIEMMFVIAIVCILFMILFPAIEHAKNMAKLAACKENIRNIAVACELYSIIDGKGNQYPDTEAEFLDLIGAGYLAKMPKCPANPATDDYSLDYVILQKSRNVGEPWYITCYNHVCVGYGMLVYQQGIGFIDIDTKSPPWDNGSSGWCMPEGWHVGDTLPEGWETAYDWTPAPGWTPPNGWDPGEPLPDDYPLPPEGWEEETWGAPQPNPTSEPTPPPDIDGLPEEPPSWYPPDQPWPPPVNIPGSPPSWYPPDQPWPPLGYIPDGNGGYYRP